MSTAGWNWLAPGLPGRGWSEWVMVAVLLSLAAWLRVSSLVFPYSHPDEIIAIAVSDNVLHAPTVDTNWKHADLPDYFQYPQYNFSGYILIAAAVRRCTGWLSVFVEHGHLVLLRCFSALLGTLCVLLTYLLGLRWFGSAVGLCAAAVVGVSPLLYQDSLYARPEAFVTFLLLFSLWLLGWAAVAPRSAAFFGAAVFGLLMATKISALLLVPLLPLAFAKSSVGGPPPFQCGVTNGSAPLGVASLWHVAPFFVAGLAVGFLAGAPMVPFNAADYFHGIEALRAQYSSGHWPHGEPEEVFPQRLAYGLRFFGGTHGIFLFVFSLAGLVALAWSRDFRALSAFALVLVVFVRFCSYPVFFERNLSHLFPLVAILCALGIVCTARRVSLDSRWRGALIVIFLLIALWRPWQISHALRFAELAGHQSARVAVAREFHASRLGVAVQQLGWVNSIEVVRDALARSDGAVLLEFWDPGDRASPDLLRILKQEDGFVEVGVVESLFRGIPASTLHTYFTPTTRFLYRSPAP